jgi:uncharacterized protein DUF6794
MTANTKERWPITKAQAVDILINELPKDVKSQIAKMTDDQLYGYHFSLGMAIRNRFGLWEGNTALITDCGYVHQPPHEAADGSSHIILAALRNRLAAEGASDE